MRRYLSWAFWNVAYLFRRTPTLESFLWKSMRTKPPWWTFKPCVWHNDDGRMWEVHFEDERDYSGGVREVVHAEVMRSLDDGRVVGLLLLDSELEKLRKI